MVDVQVKVINQSNNPLPSYSTLGASGLDVRAFLPADITLQPLERILIPTGLFIEIPIGYEIQVRPRSGLAIHHGITCLNTPGTIDADYRGEISIILINLSNQIYTIHSGDRIAQLVLQKVEKVSWVTQEILDKTDRGSGGFGHTGNQ